MGFFDNAVFDGQHNLLPSLSEVLKAFGDLGSAEWMMLFGGVLWCLILQISLMTIDRRDLNAGLTYMLFMMITGVILMIALPSHLRPAAGLSRTHLWTCALLLLTSGLRWFFHASQAQRLMARDLAAKESRPKNPEAKEKAS